MRIRKAVITAAAPGQRNLPIQVLIDQEGVERSVLSLIVREVIRAGISQICLVVRPGDEEDYARVLTEDGINPTFVAQTEPKGYGHAVFCAENFVGDEPFLHLVGDHIYVGADPLGCARQLLEAAAAEGAATSAVQVSWENALPFYGVVGGQPVYGKPGFYQVESVLEKPTPTEAEQRLVVPGLRSGQYLCFFGMHVLTPTIFAILSEMLQTPDSGRVNLSSALAVLAQKERYLAMIHTGKRFDVGVKYGLFRAQLALAVNGRDRDQVLTDLVNMLATSDVVSDKGVRR
jgi:UTP--glucose-1-phosphate uridylyltransferase